MAQPNRELQESAAIELRQRIERRKIDTYEYMKLMARATPEQLKAAGHGGKSNAETLLSIIQSAEREIEVMIKAYERKFPS
jgi:hypothetical protein